MRGYISIDSKFKDQYTDICFNAYWKNNIDISLEKNISDILNNCKIDEKKFNEDVKLIKFLFCFDKKIICFDNSWNVFDYRDLLNFLKKNIQTYPPGDEKTFIRHYILFLEEYVEKYSNLDKTCSHLFKKKLSKEEKFWLRLLNSKIALEFKNNVKGDFKYLINPGNTSTPLLSPSVESIEIARTVSSPICCWHSNTSLAPFSLTISNES